MALQPGTRLGPYEILNAIGAGGMGEVYKARDTRLDRTVAIKILPEALAADPQFRERFNREAHAISQLTHPHICTLYDVGHQDGTDFLVMEYLDGETLASRLTRLNAAERGHSWRLTAPSEGEARQAAGVGPRGISINETLTIAIETARALDFAHRAGITHRDLKPGNVMLTKSGAKLMDFGLAKTTPPPTGVVQAFRPAVPGGPEGPHHDYGESNLPTMPANLTAPGTILGTLQYMAPEQLEGREVDARADIFAFGVVLYEMVTGKKAFEGQTQASLIGAIMHSEPPSLSTLQPLTPPALDRVVHTCLAKDPDDRWQTARDLLRELKWIADTGSQAGVPAPVAVATAPHAPWRVRLAWSVAAIALLAVAALAIPAARYLGGSTPDPRPTRFEVATPPTSDPFSFALSPDGRQLAFVATTEGAPRLWVRPLDQVTAQPLQGTEGATYPFWAPDGRAIGFFAAGKLKRITLGGDIQVLADVTNGRGGTWNREGVIVFAPAVANSPLMRVAATGGTPVAVTPSAPGHGGSWPQFLPDGRRFLFLAVGPLDTRGVSVGAVDGGEPTRVLPDITSAMFVPPGSLLLVRQGVLVALRFDPTRAVVSGEAMPVAQAVGSDRLRARGAFAVSAAGVLAHRTVVAERRQLVWVDRTGNVRGAVGPPDENVLSTPELAPDGRHVAVYRTVQGNIDVWLIEVGRGVASRFTFNAAIEGNPLWSPDGRRVVFHSGRNGAFDLFEKPASGAGDEQPLLVTAAGNKFAMSWSRDGRFLLYRQNKPGVAAGFDLWALPLVGERKPFPVLQTAFNETNGQFSPDGRWVAYQSDESGRVEIYVRLFPGPGGQRQVSTDGGSQPRWRPDGKELFYVAPDGRLMAVSIAVGTDRQTAEAGAPVPLFLTRLAPPGPTLKQEYAVAPDGRFLMNVIAEAATSSPITVVLNWEAGLKK